MRSQEIRETLIARTICVIANEGLDKTTTKAITAGTGINEVYIYRYFAHKEDLLAKTFEKLDNELVDVAMCYIQVMYKPELDYKLRCRAFFEPVWKFILGNKEKCLAYIRYYYSQYFEKYSAEDHKKRYSLLVRKFSEAFREEANVWLLLNHILSVTLDFAIRVFNGEVADSEETTERLFQLIYFSIQPYLRAHDLCK